jgi:hypothetical protein
VTKSELEGELGFLQACLRFCQPGDRWKAELKVEIAKLEAQLKVLNDEP